MENISPIYIYGIVEWIEYDREHSKQWHRYTVVNSVRQIDRYWRLLEKNLNSIKACTYYSFDIKYHPYHIQREIQRRIASSPTVDGHKVHAWTTAINPKTLKQLSKLSYEQLFDNITHLRWTEKISKRG